MPAIRCLFLPLHRLSMMALVSYAFVAPVGIMMSEAAFPADSRLVPRTSDAPHMPHTRKYRHKREPVIVRLASPRCERLESSLRALEDRLRHGYTARQEAGLHRKQRELQGMQDKHRCLP